MTTARKLWLGFGILTALLVVSVAGIALWLRALERDFQAIVSVSAPLRQAVYELEINANGTGLAVFNYLASGDPAARQRAAEDALDFAKYIAQFDRVAETSQHEELSEQVAALYREYKALGDVLMDEKDQNRVEPANVQKFAELREQLDDLLDEQLQALIVEQFQVAKRAGERSVTNLQLAVLFALIAGPLVAIVTSVAVGRDIVRTERALQLAHEELEDRVRERTAELSSANVALQRSNRELEQFASVASHDLQEPLRKIQAFGDRLQAKRSAELGEQGNEYLERMLNSASRMRTLIEDLLAFSRVATKAEPFAPVALTDAANEVISNLETRIAQTNGRVEVAELPRIEADPTQIRQLLQNLIANGLKFHRPDVSPVVKITGRLLGDAEHGERCEISVEDNGIGFEEIYLDRIFEVFQRLHGRNEFEGTGIGLAICRKIVERHGGNITAKSAPGQGATFMVNLPVEQAKGNR